MHKYDTAARVNTPLSRGWSNSVKPAVLRVISLAHYAMMRTRGEFAGRAKPNARLNAENERLRAKLAQLREELRIKDARMLQISPSRRPHYPPVERMAILELKAARGWSLAKTAERFHVTDATIASWMNRLDEEGPDALVQLPKPVNKFPQFVQYLVERLKVLCPTLGKRKIAEMLARAGLHLSASTVARMLKAKPPLEPDDSTKPTPKPRVVTAKRPNHVWHVDLTLVPITSGFWIPWLPFALPQCWPFCWWVAVVVDHFSRRVMGTATFRRQPTSEAVRAFLGRAIRAAKAPPKYIICDRGKQFDSEAFRVWCKRRGIKPRYGAIGKQGSIAVVERLIRTLKENIRLWLLVPMREKEFRQELRLLTEWYNGCRPHATLGGRTPDEVYFQRFPSHRKPRYEPRSRWPRGSPCAKPWALTRGRLGARLQLDLSFYHGRKHLPLIALKRVA